MPHQLFIQFSLQEVYAGQKKASVTLLNEIGIHETMEA